MSKNITNVHPSYSNQSCPKNNVTVHRHQDNVCIKILIYEGVNNQDLVFVEGSSVPHVNDHYCGKQTLFGYKIAQMGSQ